MRSFGTFTMYKISKNIQLGLKVHLMTFDLYNFQKPHSPGGRLWEFAQETLGLKKIIVLKIPPGGRANTLLAHSIRRWCSFRASIIRSTKSKGEGRARARSLYHKKGGYVSQVETDT